MDTMSQDNIKTLAEVLKKDFSEETPIGHYPRLDIFEIIISSANLKTMHRTISICMKNKKVPLPRQSIYNEFPKFSKQQIQLFTQIFFTFLNTQSGTFRIDELAFLMKQLGHPLDRLSLCYILEKADKDNNGELSLREFLRLFQIAAEDKLCNILSVLKILVHVYQIKDMGTAIGKDVIPTNVCKKCQAELEVDNTAKQVVQKVSESKQKKRSPFFQLAKMFKTAFDTTFSKLP